MKMSIEEALKAATFNASYAIFPITSFLFITEALIP
jgi:hypothetical protein